MRSVPAAKTAHATRPVLVLAVLALAILAPLRSGEAAAPPSAPPATAPGSGSGSPPDGDAGGDTVLRRALEVRTKTLSGTPVRGLIERWNATTFSGSFGTRRWDELPAAEVNRVRRMVMDERSADQWLALGELLASLPGGEGLAESAFQRVRRLEKNPRRTAEVEATIEAARRRSAEKKRLDAEKRLREVLPEGGSSIAPWPILSEEERREAIETMKRDADRIMRDVGAAMPLVETRYFLLYSELPAKETAFWASQLDGMYEMCMDLFHVERGVNLFWGKAVVFIFPTRERFRVVEAAAFQHMVRDAVVGLCHTRGPKVFINSFRDKDELAFASVLLHETTHGIMHRYLTPRVLPTWANEDFADRIAHMAMVRAGLSNPMDRNRRRQGVDYLRRNGDVARIVRMNYTDGSWPGEDSVGYAVGYVFCNFMLDVVPRLAPSPGRDRFKEWVVAVKAGKPWEQALAEDYGFPIETLAAELVKWHRTND